MSKRKNNKADFYGLLLLAALFIIAIGTVFFHVVEDWSWVDSYYFSVVTLATVGYGDFTPQTSLGKVFTTIYLFVGVGIIAAFVQSFLRRQGHRIAEDASRRLPDVHIRPKK